MAIARRYAKLVPDAALAGRIYGEIRAEWDRTRDAVLSMHRPVLPTALGILAEATRKWTIGRLPTADPYLRPGDVLVAHLTGTGPSARVAALEHHRPHSPPPPRPLSELGDP